MVRRVRFKLEAFGGVSQAKAQAGDSSRNPEWNEGSGSVVKTREDMVRPERFELEAFGGVSQAKAQAGDSS